MSLFSRKASSDSKPDATDQQLRQIGALVNQGRLDEAQAITDSTKNPRATAFAAFRYIDLADD